MGCRRFRCCCKTSINRRRAASAQPGVSLKPSEKEPGLDRGPAHHRTTVDKSSCSPPNCLWRIFENEDVRLVESPTPGAGRCGLEPRYHQLWFKLRLK